MTLKHLKDQDILTKTEDLVARERKLSLQILHHLKEIEARRLYTELGCSSLFSYCTSALKYSDSQAMRRIDAMRLLKTLPEVEEQVQKGELSLSQVSQAQSFFKAEARVKKRP